MLPVGGGLETKSLDQATILVCVRRDTCVSENRRAKLNAVRKVAAQAEAAGSAGLSTSLASLRSGRDDNTVKVFLTLAGEFAQEFAFVHVVLEGLVAVDEDDRYFVGELAA